MANLKNRAEGMFLGLAIGDALGAQVEFDLASDIKEKEQSDVVNLDEMRGGGVHHLPTGAWTDDTSMALCLADSLLSKHGYDSQDVMEKWLAWRDHGYRSALPFCFDIGRQTNEALDDFASNPDAIIPENHESSQAGNGGIMRIAPAIIATADGPIKHAMKLAKISSRETHNSDMANAAAEVFGAMLWQALRETDKDKIISVAEFSTGEIYNDIASSIDEVKKKEFNKSELEDRGGYVVDSLRIAVWGFRGFANFADGLKAVIQLGGDTDTNGAIYGQLAGAFYGRDGIPKKWQTQVMQGAEICELADRLLAMKRCPILGSRFTEDL